MLQSKQGRRTGAFALILTVGAMLAVVLGADPAVAQEGSSEQGEKLSLFAAIVLGLVEGLTEYLPVSSTGHLLVTNKILGIGQTPEAEDALETYAIAIQIGAIFAVVVLYKDRIAQMMNGLLGRSVEGRKVMLAVIAAFVPTAIIGYALKGPVRENLFGVTPIAAAWLVGGLAILLIGRAGFMRSGGEGRSGIDLGDISTRQAVMIGVAQCLALWPGTSRSLITILAALVVGLSLRAAVEFSFLLGLVTLSAATVLSTYEGGADLVDQFGYVSPLVGLVVAFFAALASIKWMVSWLEERTFDVFGYYRIAIGLAAFAAVGVGWLE